MSESVGKQLREARLKKGLSIEDVSHETRIPVASLESLEADDYSIFPSPTYAKSFLQMYADFLEVDASEMIAVLAGPKTKGLGTRGMGMGPPPIDLTPSDTTIPIFKIPEERKESRSLITFSLIIALVILLPTFYLIGKRTGFQEQIGAQLSQTIGVEAAAEKGIESAKEVGVDPSQAGREKEYSAYEPPMPEPDAEFNALIGIDPPNKPSKPVLTSGDGSLPLLNPDSDLDN